MMDKSRIFDGILFATHLDRCRYIGKSARDRSRWLRDCVGEYQRVEDAQQEAAPPPPRAESKSNAEATAASANGMTKAELLNHAKAVIEAGDSLRDAAEWLFSVQEDFHATLREIGKAVGRSASWVSRVLKWRRSGFEDRSPFGPTTRAARAANAQPAVQCPRAEAQSDNNNLT